MGWIVVCSLSGEKLVEHETETVDIAPLGNFFTGPLLGRHVGRGAAADVAALHGAGRRCQTEIRDASLSALVDHDVRGLQVPMQDSLVVCGREPRR